MRAYRRCAALPAVASLLHYQADRTGQGSVSWDIQTLFRSHAQRVTRSLTRRGVAMDVAEDLTQDVFLRLLDQNRDQDRAIERRAPSVAMQPAPARDPAPLLLRIARNLMIDQWRREKALPRVHLAPGELEAVADSSPLAEQRVYDRQRLELTAKALSELPARTSRAFEMHRIEGRTIAEVSAELGISTTRGWTLIQDAYRHIRQTLQDG